MIAVCIAELEPVAELETAGQEGEMQTIAAGVRSVGVAIKKKTKLDPTSGPVAHDRVVQAATGAGPHPAVEYVSEYLGSCCVKGGDNS